LNILSKFSYIWKFDYPQEEEYNLFVKPSNLASLRLVTFITIFGMSLFLIVDFFKEVDYSVVLTSRICVLSLAFILMWLSYRDLSSTGIVLCVSLVPIMNFGASVVTSYYAGMPPFYITNLLFLIFVLVVTASGLHFRFALVVNLFCLITFILYSQFVNRNPFYFSQYPHLVSIFVYIHIVGIVLENRRRTNFLQFNELKAQKKLVEELNQQKNRIISILSHDVAAPMNSLSTLLHMQTHNHIDQAELNTYLPKLSDQFENVALLLYSLVRWSRSQMDGFKLDRVKLNAADLVERKLKLFQIPLLDKGLELKLTVDRSLYINADEEMMLIAIQNLLSNAIKFAHPGSVVQVKVYSNQNQGVIISITNQGQPIPEHLITKLFTYEMPVSADTRGERGTGLGLALTAFFVQLNGGSISLVPAEPGTTVFCMELPKSVLN
jgi:signal transduction histidine kinase